MYVMKIQKKKKNEDKGNNAVSLTTFHLDLQCRIHNKMWWPSPRR